VSERKSRF